MAFYRAVNLVGPEGEQLQGWITESSALQGNSILIAEDELMRPWTVGEVGPQLLPGARIQPEIRFEVLSAPKACPEYLTRCPSFDDSEEG